MNPESSAMVFAEALQRDKAMEEEAGKILLVQQWVKDCYPPNSHPGELHRAGAMLLFQ